MILDHLSLSDMLLLTGQSYLQHKSRISGDKDARNEFFAQVLMLYLFYINQNLRKIKFLCC